MKLLCAECKKEMRDEGSYIQCGNKECDVATRTQIHPIFEPAWMSFYKYQIEGRIILEE